MSKIDGRLNLTLKKKWFDMIDQGKKTEEYREYKPYWIGRLCFRHRGLMPDTGSKQQNAENFQ